MSYFTTQDVRRAKVPKSGRTVSVTVTLTTRAAQEAVDDFSLDVKKVNHAFNGSVKRHATTK